VVRKRDEKPIVVSFGGSRHSTAPHCQGGSNTFQTCSRLCWGTSRLQYDGPIPKADTRDDSLLLGAQIPCKVFGDRGTLP